MLRLYYTVSSTYNAEQIKSVNSLGRFKSSTLVQNDVFGNIFDELSLFTLVNAKDEYIALVLKNEGSEIINNVELWFKIQEKSYCDFLIGATKMMLDNEGNPYMELIPTIYSKPFQTQVYPAIESNKATIGNIAPNEEIGLWICRKINSDIVSQEYNEVAEKDVSTQNRYKPVEKEKTESVNLNISWD